ncbi:unnamed protein product [Nezara viridula]|uniref:Uncharacterized protein n=1 Tax=Nezara viridula TaxID=85310 RepID=A0A9P0HSB6_NEZVI|nr:unnamed protein product [Nezara viridula]
MEKFRINHTHKLNNHINFFSIGINVWSWHR